MENSWIKDWMYQIPYLNLSKQKMKVYAYLSHINDYCENGDIHVSNTTIAENVDMQRQNVTKVIQALVKDNLLIVTKPAVKSPIPLHKRAAHYRLIIPPYIDFNPNNIRCTREESRQMKATIEEAIERQRGENNKILVDYAKELPNIPDDTRELLVNWLSDPLGNGSYINDTLGRFKLKLNDLAKFCSANGTVNWEKFNFHISRAYKCAGVKLIYEGDIPESVEKRPVIGL